ncbi:MAG TPA: uroporphyrinogen decarboxylase family protein [Spirochaetia bacterium]|nr:uroporphyrinogen decarboxylase family protein [Spirochaetia bacterium]
MTSKERILCALNHSEPDAPPTDYYATPEIERALLQHFNITSTDSLLDILGTDIRRIDPPYTGKPLPSFDDGSFINIWGIRKKPVPNEYGDYAESIDPPYASWASIKEAERFSWPDPDSYDYDAIPALIDQYPGKAIAVGGTSVQDFINGTAFGRGVEQTLIDIAVRDPVFLFIVEKRHRFYMRHIERMLDSGKGRIDLVLCGDDFGSQRGLLISPKDFDELFASRKKELFDLAHAYGAKVSHHCCGSSRELIPRFIDLGMDALQTIQPQAKGMDPYDLKKHYAGRICLHGCMDVQGFLQRATSDAIVAETNRLMDEVGKGGGLIIAPSHNIQPDTPVEHVLAFYETIAKRRA